MARDEFQLEQPAPPPNRFRVFYRDNKRTIKIGGVLFGALILIAAVVLIIIYVLPPINEHWDNKHLDLEGPASFYRKNIRKDVNPCDDFYTFACGHFFNESVQSVGCNTTMKNMNRLALRSLEKMLSEPIATSESVILQKLKSFHSMCKDKDKIVQEGKEPMLQLLRDLGGWPLIEKGRYSETGTWEDVVGRVNRAGFRSFFPFRISVTGDPNNSSKVAILLKPLLSGKRLGSDYTREARIAYLADWLDHTNLTSRVDIGKCVDFESALFKITKPPQTSGYETYTVAKLVDKYPRISWHRLFVNVFTGTDVRATSNDSLTFDDPSYLPQVYDLLQKTSIETITNYIVWRVVEVAIEVTPLEFRNKSDDSCLQTLLHKADLAMGLVYLDNFFDHKIKEKAQPIFDNVHNQAFSYFNELKWMDNKTKKSILKRLTNIKATFGPSEERFGIDFVQKFVEGWKVQRNGSILANYRNLWDLYRRSKFRKLTMSQQEDQLIIPFLYSTEADAGHLVGTDAIFFFAALLQRPFIALDQPMYLNYGSIGFVMGHEITHGLKLLSECQNETCASYGDYQRKQKCTESLYSRYTIRQLNQTLNGSRNVEENIGDFMGLQFAYRAYEKWVNERWLSEPLLPGLNFTSRQMFWLNMATSFCSYRDDDTLKHFMANDPHSPEEARINVALANMKEFSRDFDCPAGSKMNPTEKCEF